MFSTWWQAWLLRSILYSELILTFLNAAAHSEFSSLYFTAVQLNFLQVRKAIRQAQDRKIHARSQLKLKQQEYYSALDAMKMYWRTVMVCFPCCFHFLYTGLYKRLYGLLVCLVMAVHMLHSHPEKPSRQETMSVTPATSAFSPFWHFKMGLY